MFFFTSASHSPFPGSYSLITLFVRGLPKSSTEQSVSTLFTEYGIVRAITVSTDIFSGDCRGFATIDMEGHEARAAMAALDGREIDGSVLRVGPNRPGKGRGGRRR